MTSPEARVQAALDAVLRDHGWLLAAKPVRFRAALNDVLGSHGSAERALLDALVVSAEEGVPEALRAAGPDAADDLVPELTTRLTDWGLASDRADWVVATWSALIPRSSIRNLPLPDSVPQPVTDVAPIVVEPETKVGEPDAGADDSADGVATPPTSIPPAPELPVPEVTSVPPLDGHLPTVLPAVETPQQSSPPQHTPIRPPESPVVATGSEKESLKPSGSVAASSKRPLVVGGVILALVLAAVGIWRLTAGDRTSSETSGGGQTGTSAEAKSASPGSVRAIDASPARLDESLSMAAQHVGVSVVGLGDADQVVIDDQTLTAPKGGRLIEFEVADHPCGVPKCQGWQNAKLAVDIAGTTTPLPAGGPSFVVAVPADAKSADLTLSADGYDQTISLLNGTLGPDNVAVLARAQRVTQIDRTFNVTQKNSVAFTFPDGVERSKLTRRVSIKKATLTYWNLRSRPSSSDKAFLAVDASYQLIGIGAGKTRYSFMPGEVRLVTADGAKIEPIDIFDNPKVNSSRLVFEVPAEFSQGTYRIGGSVEVVDANGVPYTQTVSEVEIPISFG